LGRTKKIGSAGRFGPRYGRRPREEVRRIEIIQRSRHICPACGKKSLRRVASGIWACGVCKKKIAGGAYRPSTGAAKMLREAMLKKGLKEDLDV
jgi:large subunit ribosomal protein L37Ae